VQITHYHSPSTDAVVTCITNNGQIDLYDYNFRLLYSRKDNDRIVARIVAEKDGVIKAKVEPQGDGEDQAEAFKALRKDVEVKLEEILASVPATMPATAGSSRTPTSNARAVSSRADLPPAYNPSDFKLPKGK